MISCMSDRHSLTNNMLQNIGVNGKHEAYGSTDTFLDLKTKEKFMLNSPAGMNTKWFLPKMDSKSFATRTTIGYNAPLATSRNQLR